MAVEIRELVLQAKVVEDEAEFTDQQPGTEQLSDENLRDMKQDILSMCERMIRSAFDQQRAR